MGSFDLLVTQNNGTIKIVNIKSNIVEQMISTDFSKLNTINKIDLTIKKDKREYVMISTSGKGWLIYELENNRLGKAFIFEQKSFGVV